MNESQRLPGTNGLAITSLVLAFVGVLIPIIGPLAGIVCGHMALSGIKRHPQDGAGLAIIGLVVSYPVFLLHGIATVGLAAGLLLPSVTAGKERAFELKCGNNMKELYMSIALEADENGGKIDFTLSDLKELEYEDGTPVCDPEIFLCPSANPGEVSYEIVPGATLTGGIGEVLLRETRSRHKRELVVYSDGRLESREKTE